MVFVHSGNLLLIADISVTESSKLLVTRVCYS